MCGAEAGTAGGMYVLSCLHQGKQCFAACAVRLIVILIQVHCIERSTVCVSTQLHLVILYRVRIPYGLAQGLQSLLAP
jgi:hypothetical protein